MRRAPGRIIGRLASTLDEDALFEREVELGRLAGALDDAARGDGRAILVLGEPGIGKTSLLKATVEQAREREFHFLTVRADALETELSFSVCASSPG